MTHALDNESLTAAPLHQHVSSCKGAAGSKWKQMGALPEFFCELLSLGPEASSLVLPLPLT